MTNPASPARELHHASCVALGRVGLLILGPSGAGKSGLALQLMAYGCQLVSDDQTELTLRDGGLLGCAPAAIRGRIEARGLGLLAADPQAEAIVRLAVDMEQVETHRLPPERCITLLGCEVPLLHKVESACFSAAILQYLKGGRYA